MARPQDDPLPANMSLRMDPEGHLIVPLTLAELLGAARSAYEWPAGTGPEDSQQVVLDNEAAVRSTLLALTPSGACKKIVSSVCDWGGNNQNALCAIKKASVRDQRRMQSAIQGLVEGKGVALCLERLSALPGLRLVMATKVYRFCRPNAAACLDRHVSYFFNSLGITGMDGVRRPSTMFRREWSTGRHTTSRLAIYNESGHKHNLNVFLRSYLPLLQRISAALNERGVAYTCAATGSARPWRPCDVEMAAYYWWAQNRPK